MKRKTSDLRIGLTGSPATGKRSVGVSLSRLTGLDFVSLNDLALKRNFTRKSNGELLVDIAKLREADIDTNRRIISGHLLPYVIPREKLDYVAILRCSPAVLRRRYLARGYSSSKVEENLEAELLDIISFKCLETYGSRKIAEFDTSRTKNPDRVAKLILDTLCGKVPRNYGVASWSHAAGRSPTTLRAAIRV